MAKIRQAAVAGRFYPADPDELRALVTDCIGSAEPAPPGPTPKAVIAPHAGLIYSGPIAGSAYARLLPDRDTITRIVLLGPAHRVPFAGLASSSAEVFETPLGGIPIDTASVRVASRLPQVSIVDAAHAREHSLEVHLPFLQELLPHFELVPFVVGDALPSEVAEVLGALWGGNETRIVISSDLSHYHDYATAQRLDRATSEAIEALDDDAIGHDGACGRNAINGLLFAARSRGMHGVTIDLRNSGDTAGPRDQVVGYGAYAFS